MRAGEGEGLQRNTVTLGAESLAEAFHLPVTDVTGDSGRVDKDSLAFWPLRTLDG